MRHMSTRGRFIFGLATIAIIASLALSACPNPAANGDPPSPYAGAWKTEGSSYFILDESGLAETKQFRGSWSVEDHRLTISPSSSLFAGLRRTLSAAAGAAVVAAGDSTWNVFIDGGLLYADHDRYLFTRTSEGAGIPGVYERIGQGLVEGIDPPTWTKELVTIATGEPASLVYEIFTSGNYDSGTGAGTWTGAMTLTGDADLPAVDAVDWRAISISIANISPSTPAFPDGSYTFCFFGDGALTINTAAMSPFTPERPSVYAGGFRLGADGIKKPGYWRDGTWTQLQRIDETLDGEVSDLVAGADGGFLAVGTCDKGGGFDQAVFWKNGTTPQSLASIVVAGDPNWTQARAVSFAGDNWYIAGSGGDEGGIERAILWENGVPLRLDSDDPLKPSRAMAVLVTSAGGWYVAGRSENSSGLGLPGYWQDGTWVDLTAASGIVDYTITSLALDDEGVVYAGGYGMEGAVRRGVYWKDGTPTEETTKYNTEPSAVLDILPLAGGVYTASDLTAINGVEVAAFRKDGLDPPVYGTKADAPEAWTKSFAIHNGDVYLGGSRALDGAVKTPGLWIDGVWTALPLGGDSGGGEVQAVAIGG